MDGKMPANNDELFDFFVESARDHANLVFQWQKAEICVPDAVAVVAAGGVVELLLKAALVRHSPALISAHRKDLKHLLILLGVKQFDIQALFDMHALGLVESLSVVQQIDRLPGSVDSCIKELASWRNAAAHLAVVADSVKVNLFPKLAAITECLLSRLGVGNEAFWPGDSHAEVQAELGDYKMRRQLKRKLLYEEAESRWAVLSGLGDKGVGLFRELIGRAEEFEEFERTPYGETYSTAVECPVCGSWAAIGGEVSRYGVHEVESRYGSDVLVKVRCAPEWFECKVCGLELSSGEYHDPIFDDTFELGDDLANEDEIEEYYLRCRGDEGEWGYVT